MSFLNKTNVGWGLLKECGMTEKENNRKRKRWREAQGRGMSECPGERLCQPVTV